MTTQREALGTVLYAVLAGKPLKPTDIPVGVVDQTTDGHITVTYGNPEPDNNGSIITSLELQMDDGISGYFQSVNGFSSDSRLTVFTVDTDVLKGRQHRFKYRAKNAVGWGPFSEEAAVLAARAPDIPERPKFNSFALD